MAFLWLLAVASAVAAFGGQGGRKIPNGVADCLLGYVAHGLTLVEALQA